MTGGAHILPRLPAAPAAEVPEGVTVDGAARTVWRPNVLLWMAIWRLVVSLQMAVAAFSSGAGWILVAAAGCWAIVDGLAAWRRPWAVAGAGWKALDLVVLIGLMVLAVDGGFGLATLYSYSAVLAWSSDHPAGAFLASGVMAVAYVGTALFAVPGGVPESFASNLALYFFFALAISGFFTVARRISALEIATEMSRERGRYRRDLHDRLGQALCGLHFELQAVEAAGPDSQTPARFDSLASGYRSARSMLEDLFANTDEPLMGTNLGLLVHQEARRMADQTGADISANVEGDASRIPPWMRPHVWSITGECITNALKNGQAATIGIDLVVENDLLVVTVTDDGVGFDAPDGQLPDKQGHYGLKEMQERARLCGGEVVVASQPGFGTRVRLQVPLPDDASADAIIDRDASTLRRTTWRMVNWLRAGLGAVAILQLLLAAADSGQAQLAIGMAGIIFLDLAWSTWRQRVAGALASARLVDLGGSIVVYAVLFGAALHTGLPPVVMLYAPLVLLLAAVAFGRQHAGWMTVAFVALCVAAMVVVALAGGHADLDGSLTHVTNLIIIGLCAAQGARLLDRLEALQIRVRYQALALIRQTLSTTMRSELIEVLDELEMRSRTLAATPPDPERFVDEIHPLTEGSTTLKTRLREIVHQLADPETGRT